MAPEIYWERLHDSKDPAGLRRKLVQFHFEHGCKVSLTARTFRCDRKTVRYWVQRFNQNQVAGLQDQRGKHQSCPHKTSEEMESLRAQPWW